MNEILNDLIENMKKREDEEYEEEIRIIDKRLRKFANKYYQQKIKEK
jgi:hypothetical protein